MSLRSCVSPAGQFIFGVHKPHVGVKNLRLNDAVTELGRLTDGEPVDNQANFPPSDLEQSALDWIYEIPNAFPFRGTTYIARHFADQASKNPSALGLPPTPEVSLSHHLRQCSNTSDPGVLEEKFWQRLPVPLMMAVAVSSTDPEDLTRLAHMACEFVLDPKSGKPSGLMYHCTSDGLKTPAVHNRPLFKAVANNPHLPDNYKNIMVLRPGAQGDSPIVGEWQARESDTHVFEYLRHNSYIPWGHYAANLADDAIRYRLADLTLEDMHGMRHLYYQRTYIRLAEELNLPLPQTDQLRQAETLEQIRRRICQRLESDQDQPDLGFNSSLWGWNFGVDMAPSLYRLHGSHQQIHQQYALIPPALPEAQRAQGDSGDLEPLKAYACGDQISDFTDAYRRQTGKPFFETYLQAIRGNQRIDGNPKLPQPLVVYEDESVLLFVPKAQTSPFELQLMTLGPVGNILEADQGTRGNLDRGLYIAVKILSALGVRMVTSIEYSKRFGQADKDQRLLYVLLPKMPNAPGAFSEAQLRWIIRHYPEDFAAACRQRLGDVQPHPNQ